MCDHSVSSMKDAGEMPGGNREALCWPLPLSDPRQLTLGRERPFWGLTWALSTPTDLFIERFCMTGGNSPICYLKAYHTNLYLSADAEKVREAIDEGKSEWRGRLWGHLRIHQGVPVGRSLVLKL